jgi:hypothetical protein
MLTDDDLTRDLRAAFREATDDLRYDGPVPAGPRTPAWARAGWVAVPAAAAVAASVVVVGGAPDVTAPPAAGPSVGSSESSGPAGPSAGSSSSAPAPELVTDEIVVLGMTLGYRRVAGDPPLVVALTSPPAVPDGAREVSLPEMAPARAWIGTDPETGVPVLYLKAPTRNEGRLTGLSGRGLDEADLESLLRHGSWD